MDPKTWIIRDAVISSRGAKSCQLELAKPDAGTDGKIRFTVGSRENPTTTPFGATTFNNEDAVQKTIEVVLNDVEVEMFRGITEWLIDYLAEHAPRIFKKEMTREQVSESLRSPVTQKGSFRPHLRCKIRPSSVRCWTAEGRIRSLPEDLRPYKLVPRVSLDRMWIMSRECGLVFQISDLLVLEGEEVECPFA